MKAPSVGAINLLVTPLGRYSDLSKREVEVMWVAVVYIAKYLVVARIHWSDS